MHEHIDPLIKYRKIFIHFKVEMQGKNDFVQFTERRYA